MKREDVHKAVFAIVVSGLYGWAIWMAFAPHSPTKTNQDSARISVMEERAKDLKVVADNAMFLYATEVQSVEDEFIRTGAEPAHARDIAWNVVIEARKAGINPWLMVAVIKVEDPTLDRHALSSAGAIGITQVMPMHAGKWGCGKDLTDVRINICTGSRIMADYLAKHWAASGGEANRRAMLSYNGCIRTPGCESYADNVLDKTDFTNPADVWAHN